MPEVLAGQTLPAGTLQQFGSLVTAWTPTIDALTTDPTLGTGATQQGWYVQDGFTVKGSLHIVFGTGPTAGSGVYTFPPPVPIAASGMTRIALGTGQIFDNSGSDGRHVGAYWVSGANGAMRLQGDGILDVTAAAPWTWAASDIISFSFCYPIA